MCLNCKTLFAMTALMISASALGPIIELPSNFDKTSPWKQLAKLGLTNLTETDCQRTCVVGESPRVCLYTFVLEYYTAMGTACGNCSKGVVKDCFRSQCIPADGHMRGVTSVNRKIPGPEIHVCKNDFIVVNIHNKIPGEVVTMHWHGISQRHSPWMDGVPYLTQCPFSGTFRYAFPVEEAGTFFYHSHTGLQRPNGHYGALIVRQPRPKEAWSGEIYDLDLPEHTMVISDWLHYTAQMVFPGLPITPAGTIPSSFLINGLGRYLNGSDTDQSFQGSHPLATFHVKRKQRYRFRIINANSLICPVLMQIEGHNMTLISTDGRPIEPVVIDGLVSYAGERYDVVIDTNNVALDKNSFWIHFRGLDACGIDEEKLDQYAVLSYDTSVEHLGIIPGGCRPTMANPLPNNTIVNLSSSKCGVSPNRLCVSDLRAIGREKDRDILTAKPDVQLFIPFGFHQYEDPDEFHKEGKYRQFMNLLELNIRSAIMNNITFKFPTTPSLFLRDTADSELCSPDNLPATCKSDDGSKTPYCACPYFVTVKENDIVEMTLVNEDIDLTAVDHPIHLHGYGFYVMHVDHDSTRSKGYTMDEVQKILLKNANQASSTPHAMPAVKDSINVPVKGFVTVRWRADNPGDWLMHCHFEWHMSVGMTMGVRVLGKIPPKPPGLPTCPDFEPLLLPD